jgi:hypothetical protein
VRGERGARAVPRIAPAKNPTSSDKFFAIAVHLIRFVNGCKWSVTLTGEVAIGTMTPRQSISL